MSIYSDKLAHIKVVINCQYSVHPWRYASPHFTRAVYWWRHEPELAHSSSLCWILICTVMPSTVNCFLLQLVAVWTVHSSPLNQILHLLNNGLKQTTLLILDYLNTNWCNLTFLTVSTILTVNEIMTNLFGEILELKINWYNFWSNIFHTLINASSGFFTLNRMMNLFWNYFLTLTDWYSWMNLCNGWKVWSNGTTCVPIPFGSG